MRENLRVLKSEFENIKLEHNYLSSSEKLLEYQSQYFEDELIQKNIENIKIFKIQDKEKKIQNLKITKEQWNRQDQKLLLKTIEIILFIKKMKQI